MTSMKRMRYAKYFYILGWTVFVVLITVLFNNNAEISFYNSAIASSEKGLIKDYMYRSWASYHRGVYLKVSDTGIDSIDYKFINPVKMSEMMLDTIFSVTDNMKNFDISERIIKLSSDTNLTDVEKEALEFLKSDKRGNNISIPGVKTLPFDPEPLENSPQPAGKKMKSGLSNSPLRFEAQNSFVKLVDNNGIKIIKIIKPIRIDRSCMVCHKEQGYVEDSLVAITSFSSSLKGTEGELKKIINLGYVFGLFFWLLGVVFIEYGYRRLKHYTGELHTLNDELGRSQLKLSELNSNKDKYFSILSHDLKNSFYSLLSYSDYLSTDFDNISSSDLKAGFTQCRRSSKRIYNLLEDLLTWNKMQTGTMEYNPDEFNAYEVVQESVDLLNERAQQKDITLVNELEKGMEMYADPEMFKAIIRNLTSNAIKFTSKNGEIKITGMYKDDRMVFGVIDNGIGIDKDNIEKLFRIDSSFSTKGTAQESGTGLGLIICKDMVEKHGGAIWVKSKPGIGSKFYFSIPRRKNL
jgi:signal transduction histidine kinase